MRSGTYGLIRRIAPLALLAPLGGCDWDVLNPAGPIQAAENQILANSIVIMLCIVVPTMVATVLFAWWFRASNTRARYRPDFAYSGRIELVTWSIPVLVVLFLGGVAWTGSQALDPAQPLPGKSKPLDIQVISLDWKWLFLYPDQNIASVNELVIPAGTPVHFTLTSASVMTAFFVPQLGSMIYTMNGMATQLYLQADHPGSYAGRASHFSGDGFSDMHFTTRAVDAAGFDQWVRGAQASSQVLDAGAYDAFARQSAAVPPATWRLADPTLFQDVLSLKRPPGPGPEDKPSPSAAPPPSALKGNT